MFLEELALYEEIYIWVKMELKKKIVSKKNYLLHLILSLIFGFQKSIIILIDVGI